MPHIFDRRDRAEGLHHDLPPVILFERRRCPDRRGGWRGGRRDTDWINRPPDSLARIARSQDRANGWWRRWRSAR